MLRPVSVAAPSGGFMSEADRSLRSRSPSSRARRGAAARRVHEQQLETVGHESPNEARPRARGRRAVQGGRQRRPGLRDGRARGRQPATRRRRRRCRRARARRRARQPHLPGRRGREGYRVAAGIGSDTSSRAAGLERDVVDRRRRRRRSTRAEDRRRLRLPAHARRHLAVDDRAPSGTGRQGSVPDRDRVLRLLAGRSEVAAAEHADRAAARLRDRRHQHARHRLFGRRLRLLRAAAVDRRVRRDRDDRRAAVGRAPQGRHGRPLVPRHQPAVRRAAPAAAPRRDRAAVGDRRHDQGHARSGRHPQLRLRGRVGQGSPARRPARPAAASRGRPIASRPATRPVSRTRPCTARRPTSSRDQDREVLDRRDRACRCRPSTS